MTHLLHVDNLWWIFAELLDREFSVAEILKLAGRPAECNLLSDLQSIQVLRHFTAVGEFRMHVGLVNFHNQIHEAFIVVRADRCVRSDHEFSFDLRGKMDMLADRKAQDVLLRRQPEAILSGVVRNFFLLD